MKSEKPARIQSLEIEPHIRPNLTVRIRLGPPCLLSFPTEPADMQRQTVRGFNKYVAAAMPASSISSWSGDKLAVSGAVNSQSKTKLGQPRI